MNEPQFIKCHMFTTDGTIKEYNIYPNDYPPNYTMYLYHGELYFREILQYGNRQNIMIHKEEFDRLVNPAQAAQQTRQGPPPIVNVSGFTSQFRQRCMLPEMRLSNGILSARTIR